VTTGRRSATRATRVPRMNAPARRAGLRWGVSQRGKTDDDQHEFERAMKDVAPLAPDPRGRVQKVPHVQTPRSGDAPVERDDSAPESYVAPGVDRRELKRLKRGDHAVRGRLDLHGLTAIDARTSVARFLENSRHARHRCVCIVHGRGLNSAGGVPVLRATVREVLLRAAGVLAFTSAPPSDGGSGAVYVLLRR
jgi:DNA-nicking Smr family endonuclease